MKKSRFADEQIGFALRQQERLESEAAKVGLTLRSFKVTLEPIPDPAVEALSKAEQKQIDRISRAMYDDPAALDDQLVALVAKHPHIPMLRNHLACALNARGEHERAAEVNEETVRLFPDYIFGFANHVMTLMAYDDLDAARALLETGPRGPLLFVGAFAPERTVFHVTEILCYCGMVGHYLLATDRLEAAKVQLQMMESVLPDHPQTRGLAQRIEMLEMIGNAQKMIGRLKARTKKPTAKGSSRRGSLVRNAK